MGRSLSAKLVYGYDLGGGEDEWKIREVDEYGDLQLHWHDADSDDFIGDAEQRLLAVVAGFTETWETKVDDDYFARESDAKKGLGVDFEWYGVTDSSSWLLAAYFVDVGWSGLVDLAELQAHPDREKWDAALASAVAALGITPTQEQPGWVLCANYG